MKTIILAGGFGSRLSEETMNKPKPMVEIGGRPILWHKARFGGLAIDHHSMVCRFTEKPQIGEGWINGGFLVFYKNVLNMITDNLTSLECEVLEKLATMGQLAAFCHEGFWQCVDTLRDLKYLETLWNSGHTPWKVW